MERKSGNKKSKIKFTSGSGDLKDKLHRRNLLANDLRDKIKDKDSLIISLLTNKLSQTEQLALLEKYKL